LPISSRRKMHNLSAQLSDAGLSMLRKGADTTGGIWNGWNEQTTTFL
jgi:hypothetical protein